MPEADIAGITMCYQGVAGHRTGHNEGQLTVEDIDTAARSPGVAGKLAAD